MKERVTDGFFLATKYTTREDPYKAPEQVLEFDARLVTATPQGEPIAFGFARWEGEDWTPTGFGLKEWVDFKWYLKSEGDNA